MEASSALLAICAGTAQRPVTQSFDVFFDLRLNKQLSKEWWGWWFGTSSRTLWRHCYVLNKEKIEWNLCLEKYEKFKKQ